MLVNILKYINIFIILLKKNYICINFSLKESYNYNEVNYIYMNRIILLLKRKIILF